MFPSAICLKEHLGTNFWHNFQIAKDVKAECYSETWLGQAIAFSQLRTSVRRFISLHRRFLSLHHIISPKHRIRRYQCGIHIAWIEPSCLAQLFMQRHTVLLDINHQVYDRGSFNMSISKYPSWQVDCRSQLQKSSGMGEKQKVQNTQAIGMNPKFIHSPLKLPAIEIP